jgi:hypothetical protein
LSRNLPQICFQLLDVFWATVRVHEGDGASPSPGARQLSRETSAAGHVHDLGQGGVAHAQRVEQVVVDGKENGLRCDTLRNARFSLMASKLTTFSFNSSKFCSLSRSHLMKRHELRTNQRTTTISLTFRPNPGTRQRSPRCWRRWAPRSTGTSL